MQSSGACLRRALLQAAEAPRHCCNAQSSLPRDVQRVHSSCAFGMKFLCVLSHQLHEVAQAMRCIWCQTCCILVEGLYSTRIQGPGPLGTALLRSASLVQQSFLTRGRGRKVFVEVSNEDARCAWPQAWLSGTGADVFRQVTSPMWRTTV